MTQAAAKSAARTASWALSTELARTLDASEDDDSSAPHDAETSSNPGLSRGVIGGPNVFGLAVV
ncbi:hypothetical protein B1756_08315 [Natrarchaeobaculum aegyptiacum]|uniref:Uncharacterized protein n=1 Tax=Natrarchaeobaculum aegyptiacum TaxID=745377 RepID=A0A2Z2HSK4_9EURY|nr:hypothetical protein B1756_08315 [Natrarchaeobaculum aegyptiacum]